MSKGIRINPAWETAAYQEDCTFSDGKIFPNPYPKRGNKIENGQILDPIEPFIEVDDLPATERRME